MSLSATVSGIVLAVLGVVLLIWGVAGSDEIIGTIVLVLYGLIALGVGVYLIFNQNKEDKIEQIKKNKNKR